MSGGPGNRANRAKVIVRVTVSSGRIVKKTVC